MRILKHIDLHHIPRLMQQESAVLAQMPQVQRLPRLAILLRERINRFNRRVIHHARVAEFDHDIIGIVRGIKELAELADTPKEQRPIEFIHTRSILVIAHHHMQVLRVLPREDQHGHDHTDDHRERQIRCDGHR